VAHTRKDTYVKPGEWWAHLRPFNKRLVAKAERKEAVRMIEKEKVELKDEKII
jgi:hypothetical protein